MKESTVWIVVSAIMMVSELYCAIINFLSEDYYNSIFFIIGMIMGGVGAILSKLERMEGILKGNKAA